MSVAPEIRKHVRERAKFACEFCGVTETDVGGELTVDHYRPQARDGTDDPENLLYCCSRCNSYKAGYWPTSEGDLNLWNPRIEAREVHMLLLTDGTVFGITSSGVFTINRLRMNRPPLVVHRLREQVRAERDRMLSQYRDLLDVFGQLQRQHADLFGEQRALLQQQQSILRQLLGTT